MRLCCHKWESLYRHCRFGKLGKSQDAVEQKERADRPLQLIPPQPSLHWHAFPSSRKCRSPPSARESHSAYHKPGFLSMWAKTLTWRQAVDTSPPGRTVALSIIRIAFSVLTTCKCWKHTVEARRTFPYQRITRQGQTLVISRIKYLSRGRDCQETNSIIQV